MENSKVAAVATCRICRRKFAPQDREQMFLHLLTKHPLHLLTSRHFVQNVSSAAYGLGALVAKSIRGRP